jgi:hypothetical protein
MTIKNVQPKRGSGDFGSEQRLQGSPHSLFMQVERTRDDREGQHPIRYFIGYEYGYADIPACTAAGGAGAGAGATVQFPELPANARILSVMHETLTAFVNDAATQDIDGVSIGDTSMIADAAITAAAGLVGAPLFTLAEGAPNVPTFIFPFKLATPATPKVYFAGANTVRYTAGAGIFWIEVVSYMDK